MFLAAGDVVGVDFPDEVTLVTGGAAETDGSVVVGTVRARGLP